MPQQDPSRTEDPTKKRIKKSRDKGSVARSQEVGKVAVILAGVIILRIYLPYIGEQLMDLFRFFFTESFVFTLNKQNIYNLFLMGSVKIAIMVMPVLLVLGFFAFLSARLQVGSLWTTQVFTPKFGKLFNIVAGVKKLMLDPQVAIRLGKSILMAGAIAIAPYLVLKREMHNIIPLFYQNAQGLAAYMLDNAADMVIYAILPMLIIASLDLWYTRWDYNEQLKMTKDEVKDERKQAEGDPKIKRQQRVKMMEVMMRRMIQEVPKADVVITNPIHLAVALRYDVSEAPAPRVLAKGANRIAERIKEVAREHNVPIRENKPLAQALYKSVEIGDTIPEELFQAVASILASLYKFRASATT
ncbi:MAG: flagellar biosynthesis protein FlhB [Desulfovibrio sp.]|nr:MAG: flagellar biosynthesis protein FlhB [Desulfovibrio sp.]